METNPNTKSAGFKHAKSVVLVALLLCLEARRGWKKANTARLAEQSQETRTNFPDVLEAERLLCNRNRDVLKSRTDQETARTDESRSPGKGKGEMWIGKVVCVWTGKGGARRGDSERCAAVCYQ